VKLGSNGKHASRHATEGTLVPSLAQRPVATDFHACLSVQKLLAQCVEVSYDVTPDLPFI
jgi:hypothetical protein